MNKLFKLMPALLVVLMISTAGTVFVNDFNGTWKLDESKIDAKDVSEGNALPTDIRLLKTDTAVLFERTFTSIPDPSKQLLKLDGTELITKKGDTETTRTLGVSKDNRVLTVKSKVHVAKEGEEPWDYTRTETYELAKDGKSLTLTRVLVYPDKTETSKGVYNREK